ncbi:unnamed protein product [Rhizoctonia solani]|uniref:Benzoate 4-monooxygenase n=1 Tax=Rhizoctonia solani TaxID=456999 RepID=A0A8H3D260_9AGAM|nr:unnamed protein product [Rhizoctonia solani]
MITDSFQPAQCIVTAAALTLVFYIVPYLLDPYDYRRRFSGPPLAAFTNWWMSSLIRAGHHNETVYKLHEQYGTFVRLGPNHVSIADPDALETVYGHGSGLLKSEFYRIFVNGETDVFSTDNKVEHAHKRKRLANIFSPQNVLAFEPRVRDHIRELCAQWDLRCKQAARGVSGANWTAQNEMAVIDVSAQFPYLTFDIIGDLALGSSFGLIQAQKDSSPAIESVDASGVPMNTSLEIPVVSTIAKAGGMCVAVGYFPSWAHKFLQLLPWNLAGGLKMMSFMKLTKISVDARIKRGPRTTKDGRTSVDLIEKLLAVKNKDGTPLAAEELYAEAFVLLLAGSDTTSHTMSSVCYFLAVHPEAQQKLQAELDQHIPYDTAEEIEEKRDNLAVPPVEAVVQYEQIKSLPYLNACIKEAMRLYSTVGTGLPRVVPKGKAVTIAGQLFREGSVISVPSYTTNRSSVWGSDAGEFRPERWLGDNVESLNKYFVPFSIGSSNDFFVRACIGRNLAYMNLLLITASVFRRYEVKALPTTKVNVFF